MPEKRTLERARRDKREGKRPTTQAGEFVREEMEHGKRGKHEIRSRKQAIAIGLSKARRAGVDLPAPRKGEASAKTRKSASRAHEAGQRSGELSGGGRGRKAARRPAAKKAARSGGRTSSRRRGSKR